MLHLGLLAEVAMLPTTLGTVGSETLAVLFTLWDSLWPNLLSRRMGIDLQSPASSRKGSKQVIETLSCIYLVLEILPGSSYLAG